MAGPKIRVGIGTAGSIYHVMRFFFAAEKCSNSHIALFRVVETVVLENGRFVPCRKQVVFTKIGENSDSAFCPQKQGIFAPKPDENDENGGCHPSKMTVCQKHRFDNPDL